LVMSRYWYYLVKCGYE